MTRTILTSLLPLLSTCQMGSAVFLLPMLQKHCKLLSGELIPDVIFLDLNMPIINGQEFLATLKSTAGLQDIPVIILSTASDSLIAYKLKAEGASGFLTKPTSIKELSNLLSPYLK